MITFIQFNSFNSKGIYLKSIAFWDKGGNTFPLLNSSAKFSQDLSVFERSLFSENDTWQNLYHTLYQPETPISARGTNAMGLIMVES